MNKYAVVTIAVGNDYYLKLAKNLLLSFLKWNEKNDINFILVTDNRNFYSSFFNEKKVEIKHIDIEEQDRSFTSKFLLFEHVNAKENLFIDCDCIIYNDLTSVFKKFQDQDFSVIGENIKQGSFFCDAEQIINKLNLNYLPKFVGSVYYFKNNAITKSIFEMAKNLKSNYDELGFIRLRGKENEEPLFAAAMAAFNQHPIIDDGTIKADAMFYNKFRCNVITGLAVFSKTKQVTASYYSPNISTPVIVHYNDRYSEMADYLADEYRLTTKLPNHLTNIIVQLKYLIPFAIFTKFKGLFRPVYHKILGPSKIKKIKRV
ncbi:MAG: hypothetical protein V4546_04675 [Bacteroidota bacterium]